MVQVMDSEALHNDPAGTRVAPRMVKKPPGEQLSLPHRLQEPLATLNEDRSTGYAPRPSRAAVLAVTVGLHLVAVTALASARFEAREEAPAQRVASFALSEPPPPPPRPQTVPEAQPQPVAAPVVAPSAVLELPRPVQISATETVAVNPQIVPATLVVPAPAAPATPALASPAPAPMVPPDFTAAQLRNPGPTYPYLSRKAREEGVVLLKVLVGVEGRATRLEIEESSGFDRLDEAALKTVKKWRFVPASQAGEPREAWVLVPVTFSLG